MGSGYLFNEKWGDLKNFVCCFCDVGEMLKVFETERMRVEIFHWRVVSILAQIALEMGTLEIEATYFDAPTLGL